jgi:hypothetical protein
MEGGKNGRTMPLRALNEAFGDHASLEGIRRAPELYARHRTGTC